MRHANSSRPASSAPVTPAVADPLLAAIRALVREEIERALAAKPGLVTIDEFAASKSLSPTTIRAAIREGRLAATKIGRSVRIAADATIGTPIKRRELTSQRAHILAIAGGVR
jgi:excisionase family DNA binding protein